MLNAQSAKVYFSEFAFKRANWKVVGSNFFGKLEIDGNLVVKSKVLPCSGSVALRQLNPIHKKGSKSCFLKKKNKKNKKKIAHEIKPTQKNEFELGDIYIPFIYRSISFYRKHLEITCKLYTPVRLKVRGISHGTLFH